MTDPKDNIRATILCNNVGESNCIITGDGFYDGAAEVTLLNINIRMVGKSYGRCIQLNSGYGGAYSPYWEFYVNNSGRKKYSKGYTLLKNMDISGCGSIGIKLSTFISGVVMENLHIHDLNETGIEMRNGNDVIVRNCTIERVSGSGIIMGGGSKHNLVERTLIRNFGDRGVLVGSDNTEVQYMDVDYATKNPNGSWHDAINCTIRNNIIAYGAGAGIAFYSAKDIVAVQNTVFEVGMVDQGAILLNLSPKLLGANIQVYPVNKNITLKNNVIVASSLQPNLPIIEARIMQATVPFVSSPPLLPNNSICSNTSTHRVLTNNDVEGSISPAYYSNDEFRVQRRRLMGQPFAVAVATMPGSQGRNKDGSCPIFPSNNLWHLDVRSLPAHPNSKSIKLNIAGSGTGIHHDWGGGFTVNSNFIPYGIPFTIVNGRNKPKASLNIAPSGYPDECDYPLSYPFSSDSPVEGAYLNCPPSSCSGDRHVIVLDNSTCMLYETWHSNPPGVTGSSSWSVDIAVKFNLSNNLLRPLGWSSADAAGLPIFPGLVKFEEVIKKGVIDHALRFTVPNSRAAYSMPATHFAAVNPSVDSPWMGLRVRLNSSFNCTPLARASRIFCVALQKYGGICADNGSPWYFSGEATSNWDPYLNELNDISKIPISFIDVLDSGCLCLDSGCITADCGNGILDPNALPVYGAVDANSTLQFDYNIYYKKGVTGRYVDRRTGGELGSGYDGSLAGWSNHFHMDQNSIETDPKESNQTFQLAKGSPGLYFAPPFPGVTTDFYGAPLQINHGRVSIGVLVSNTSLSTTTPSLMPTGSVPTLGTRSPAGSTYSPTLNSVAHSTTPSSNPSLKRTFEPTKPISGNPSILPTSMPTARSNAVTRSPSSAPTTIPSSNPSLKRTFEPTKPISGNPSILPTSMPTARSNQLTQRPSLVPTATPSVKQFSDQTKIPSRNPSMSPTTSPTWRSNAPTRSPSVTPTRNPSLKRTLEPSKAPSRIPSVSPTARTNIPTRTPSLTPTRNPSQKRTPEPTKFQSRNPTFKPSSGPTRNPTTLPTIRPVTTKPTIKSI